VESHKATAKQAAKRKLLVFQQVDFALKEAKLERERQALEIKLRRTEETPVQYNWAQVPLAYAGVSGIARQTTSVSIATSRQELVRAAYQKDLQPSKEQRGSVSAGADPSKELQPPKVQQLADTVGISPLLKLAKELATITGNLVDRASFRRFPG
jgi:hypothetical protein